MERGRKQFEEMAVDCSIIYAAYSDNDKRNKALNKFRSLGPRNSLVRH